MGFIAYTLPILSVEKYMLPRDIARNVDFRILIRMRKPSGYKADEYI